MEPSYIRPAGARRARRLKNDADLRMSKVVAGTDVWMPYADLRALDPKNLDHWIEELRKGETSVRHLRKRLEALRDGSARTCPECGRPVAGRADKVYCTTECRVRAHRAAQKD